MQMSVKIIMIIAIILFNQISYSQVRKDYRASQSVVMEIGVWESPPPTRLFSPRPSLSLPDSLGLGQGGGPPLPSQCSSTTLGKPLFSAAFLCPPPAVQPTPPLSPLPHRRSRGAAGTPSRILHCKHTAFLACPPWPCSCPEQTAVEPTRGSCGTTPGGVGLQGKEASGRQVRREFTGKPCMDNAGCQAACAEDFFHPGSTISCM